jgi:hypothetical protein
MDFRRSCARSWNNSHTGRLFGDVDLGFQCKILGMEPLLISANMAVAKQSKTYEYSRYQVSCIEDFVCNDHFNLLLKQWRERT